MQTKYVFVACLDRSKLTSTITSLIKNDRLASKNTERNEWSVSSLIVFCEMASETYINLNVLRVFSLKQLLVKMDHTNRSNYIGLENADTMFENTFHLPVMVQNLHAKNCRLYLFIF